MTPRTLILTVVAIVTLGLLAAASAVSAAAPEHEIAPGESLTSIAEADGLSVAQLAAANGLSPTAELTAGVTLSIPPQSNPGTAAPGPATPSDTSAPASAAPGGGYRVAFGDTLSAIAARYGVTVQSLAAANGLNPAGVLPAGATLTIPGATLTTPDATPAAVSAGAQPTDETVTPSEVGAVAASNGVSPTLAEAIANEESGFNNDEVSPTGAVGVMQIEPSTWQYVRSELGGPPLNPASAQDNVLGGVELLHSLLEQTGGDQQLAAAGYYQGLGSVRAHGIYVDTRRYVRDVMALQTRFGGG
ncbi:MAG: LysM peptidoglycan-binding domain-containing protein [Solirubrobacteraceae bacterium]